jgi:radical SAM protein
MKRPGHPAPEKGARRSMGFSVDFSEAPLLVIWEVTRACELACQHCRADAINFRDPRELTLQEGKQLLNRIKAMGTPIVVLTGGDPIQRDDLESLIVHGKSLGLRMGTIPAGTPRLTRERIRSLKDAGIDQVAFSIDGPNARKHDEFRRVPGSFDLTIQGARWAREEGIPLQINTVLSQFNYDDFEALAALVESLGIVFWEVFFLVPTGRGAVLESCTAEQFETLFGKLHTLSRKVDFMIKVTEGQHYRRFVLQQDGAHTGESGEATEIKPSSDRRAIGTSSKVVNAGNGFCFVDHVGDIYPSGFLSIVAGNVRNDDIAGVYRSHPVFLELRNPSLLKGKCGRCEFKRACGGSRSRSHAVHGDYLAEEPLCILER